LGIEQRAVRRDGHGVGSGVLDVVDRRPIVGLTDQHNRRDAIASRLLADLASELARWAEIGDALAPRSAAPFGEEQPDEGFAGAGR
jgi:hypothetical protein